MFVGLEGSALEAINISMIEEGSCSQALGLQLSGVELVG